MSKEKFVLDYTKYNQFNHRKIVSCKCSGLKKTYKYQYNDLNEKVLVFNKFENLYELIQSHKDDTNIYNILDRYYSGELNLFDHSKLTYLDTTKLPKNINDLNNMLLDIEENFKVLPTEFKEIFNSNYGVFAKSIQDGTFKDKVLSNKEMLKEKFNFDSNKYFNIKDEVKEDIKENKKGNEDNEQEK